MNVRERIIELFTRGASLYTVAEASSVLGISAAALRDAITSGRVAVTGGKGDSGPLAWADVASLALDQWTAGRVAGVLQRASQEDRLPRLNQYRTVRVSLPLYLIHLLDHLARNASGTRGDLLEVQLLDLAGSLDLAAIERAIPGFTDAVHYPDGARPPATSGQETPDSSVGKRAHRRRGPRR